MWKAHGGKEPECNGKPGRRLIFWGRCTDPQGTESVIKHAQAVGMKRKLAEEWDDGLRTNASHNGPKKVVELVPVDRSQHLQK